MDALTKSICDHVILEIDKKDRVVTVVAGPTFPYFGWSRKLQADTPRIRCSVCHEHVQIKGYVVKRNIKADDKYLNYQKEQTRGKTAARSKTRKSNPDPPEEQISWVFLD